MAFKKSDYIIAFVIGFWIIFIAWGLFKSSVKLYQKKPDIAALNKIDQQETSNKPANKKAPEQAQKKAATPTPANPEPQETSAILVRTIKVKPADFQDFLPVMGTIKGKTETELRFELNGVIKSIAFREGEKIKKGQTIACLEPKDAQLKLTYAENRFNAAQSAYNSVRKKLEVHKKLYEAGAIIKSKLEEVELECESAKYQVETTKNEVELAENELNKTCLLANKDGVMGPRQAEEGEFVTAQDKIGTLLETGEVFVEVGVVERDIEKIKLGQMAKVYVDAYPDMSFAGEVDNIYPVIEGKSRTLTVKIKVANPQGQLFPGMFSRAEIYIVELKHAYIVPPAAIIHMDTGANLIPVVPAESLQVNEDGAQVGNVQFRMVKLGYISSDHAQVIDGLKDGDLVVTETQGELKDKARVRILAVEETF